MFSALEAAAIDYAHAWAQLQGADNAGMGEATLALSGAQHVLLVEARSLDGDPCPICDPGTCDLMPEPDLQETA